MKKRVLICGASGFIGRNVFETLSKRDDLEVRGTYLTRDFLSDDPRLIQADLTCKEDALKVTKDVDVIIQAAATTSTSIAMTTTFAQHKRVIQPSVASM